MGKKAVIKYCCILVIGILIFVIGIELKKSQNEYRKGMLKTILMQQTGAESVSIEIPSVNSSPEDRVFDVLSSYKTIKQSIKKLRSPGELFQRSFLLQDPR